MAATPEVYRDRPHSGTKVQTLAAWRPKRRETAMMLTSKYGQPNIGGDRLLVWFNNGPYVKRILSRDPVPHNRTAMAFKQGDRSSPYARGLMFQQMPNAADPDRPMSQ